MASNPRWCRSLPDWVSSFDEWVHKSEPQEIIDISVFFDFRTVYGDAELKATNCVEPFTLPCRMSLPSFIISRKTH